MPDTKTVVTEAIAAVAPIRPMPVATPAAIMPAVAPPPGAMPMAAPAPHPFIPEQQKTSPDRSIAARWTPRLAKGKFTPIPAVFLEKLQQLRPHENARGLNPTESMIIIQLLSYKWDKRAPYPTLTSIGERLGLTVRTVRGAVRRLEELGYVRREMSKVGGPNRYHFDGLFKALEALLDDQKTEIGEEQAS